MIIKEFRNPIPARLEEHAECIRSIMDNAVISYNGSIRRHDGEYVSYLIMRCRLCRMYESFATFHNLSKSDMRWIQKEFYFWIDYNEE